MGHYANPGIHFVISARPNNATTVESIEFNDKAVGEMTTYVATGDDVDSEDPPVTRVELRLRNQADCKTFEGDAAHRRALEYIGTHFGVDMD